jgi:hypothetical protein
MENNVEISRPYDVHHVVSLKINKQTGKIEVLNSSEIELC